MRSHISIAILAGALLAGCGKEVKLERRAVKFPNGKSIKEDWTITRSPNGDTLEHGVHRKFFWNGNTEESVIWKMGKRDGSAQAWYESGELKWQKTYEDGKKKGTWRLFYRDGQPWITAIYEMDALKGPVEVWDKSGAEAPRKAEFANGSCVSGDCALLDAPVIPPEITPAEKVALTRDWEIVRAFLE